MTLEQRSDSAAAGHEACDQPIRSLEILNQCVPLFETLKDPNRQQLLVQLVCHGPQTVGELAESSALSRTAVSHHIKLLEQAGFIEISKDATRRICSVRAAPVRAKALWRSACCMRKVRGATWKRCPRTRAVD